MAFDKALLERALSTDELAPDARLQVERMGDRAFDFLLGQIRGEAHDSRVRVRALHLLSLLSRQFCAGRKDEVLEVGMECLSTDDLRERSAAASVVVGASSVLAKRAPDDDERPPQARVARALEGAMRRGFDPERTELVREYLAGRQ